MQLKYVLASALATAATATDAPAGEILPGGGGGGGSGKSSATDTPNIIVIVVDDIGIEDLHGTDAHPYNSFGEMYTPNIDTLLENGVKLNRFYSNPMCTPTRAALMTGLYPASTGMQDLVIHDTEARAVPTEYKFISEQLQDAGYATALMGKWHLGFYAPMYAPLGRGFDRHFGLQNSAGDHYLYATSGKGSWDGEGGSTMYMGYNLFNDLEAVYGANCIDEDWNDYPGAEKSVMESRAFDNMYQHYWSDDAETPFNTAIYPHSNAQYSKASVDWMQEQIDADTPFFLYLAYQSAHTPMQAESDYKEFCEDMTVVDGFNENNACSVSDPGEDCVEMEERELLCGMVAQFDAGIGDIYDSLKDNKVWKDTLIFFFADNGGNPGDGACNGDLRGEKTNYWEGGIRVPAFMSGGFIGEKYKPFEGDVESNAVIHVSDVPVTICNLVEGCEAPDYELDGVDQWQYMLGISDVPARTELLHNVNSDWFMNSGALRWQDYHGNPSCDDVGYGTQNCCINCDDKSYKMVVNPEGYEKVYNQVMTNYLPNEMDEDELKLIIEDWMEMNGFIQTQLFNIEANEEEIEIGDPPSGDLSDKPLYKDTIFEHMQQLYYNTYLPKSHPTTFAWHDNGDESKPALWGNHWHAWVADEDDDGTGTGNYAMNMNEKSLMWQALYHPINKLSDTTLAAVAGVAVCAVATAFVAVGRAMSKKQTYTQIPDGIPAPESF